MGRAHQVLVALRDGELASGEIARRTGMRKRYVSQLVVRLTEGGLIEREQRAPDFRFVFYRLTRRGRALIGGGHASTQARGHEP